MIRIEEIKSAFENYEAIIFDFDGVIKCSNNLKEDAFAELFAGAPMVIQKRIRQHHRENLGVSRFSKLPLYLEWNGILATPSNIEFYAECFSKKIVQRVIESEWIAGVKEFIKHNSLAKRLYIASATPQDEIILIARSLKISEYFNACFGSPFTKTQAVEAILSLGERSDKTCFIGDAINDYKAAKKHEIDFIYRADRFDSFLSENSVFQISDFRRMF